MEHDGLNDHERVRVRASTRETRRLLSTEPFTAQNAPFMLTLRNNHFKAARMVNATRLPYLSRM